MGVIFLALISYGAASSTDTMPPLWVIVSCAVAIAAGTYVGGWRVIRTMGKGLVEIESPQGFAAESSTATIILLSSHFGYALSTTHVATGSILGSGVGKPVRTSEVIDRNAPELVDLFDHLRDTLAGRHGVTKARYVHVAPSTRGLRLKVSASPSLRPLAVDLVETSAATRLLYDLADRCPGVYSMPSGASTCAICASAALA